MEKNRKILFQIKNSNISLHEKRENLYVPPPPSPQTSNGPQLGSGWRSGQSYGTQTDGGAHGWLYRILSHNEAFKDK